MDTIVNKFKSMYRTSIIFSILLICLGIFLLVNPETTLVAISYFVGIVLIIWGLIPMISFFTNKESKNYLEAGFMVGVISFIFGIFVMINPTVIVSIIPLLLGIWMIVNGTIKLYYAVVMNREVNSLAAIIISSIILICGITLVCNPFGGAKIMTKIVGIFLIVYSALDLTECFTLKRTYNSVKKDIKEITKTTIIDADYKEKSNSKKDK